MNALKTLKEINKELKTVTSCATGIDRFMAKCFPLMIKLNMEQNQLLTSLLKKRKRKKTSWQKFVSKYSKQGYSLKEIAKLWKTL